MCPQGRTPRFDPWIRKIPWRSECNPLHVLAWRIPWTEEPGGLQFMGSQRFGYYWATNTYKCSTRVCFWRTETKEIGRMSGEHSLNQEGGEAFTILKCYPSSIMVRFRGSADKLPGSKFRFCLENWFWTCYLTSLSVSQLLHLKKWGY